MTFKLAPEVAKQMKRRNLLRITLAFAIVAVIAVAGAIILEPASSAMPIFTIVVLMAVAFLLGMFLVRKGIHANLLDQITLDNDSITEHRLDGQQIRVHRAQVKQVIEVEHQGIRLVAAHPNHVIFIPIELDDFERLKSLVSNWSHPIVETSNRHGVYFAVTLSSLVALGILAFFTGHYPRQWTPIVYTVLGLAWVTLIVAELISGKATIGDGPPVSREDVPWLYWLFVLVQAVVLILCLQSISLQKLQQYDLQILFAMIALVLVWAILGTIAIIRYVRKSEEINRI